MIFTVAVIVLIILLVVYVFSADTILGKRVTTTSVVTSNASGLCNASSVTAIGTVTRVNSDKSIGVTWDIIYANPPYPDKADTTAKCTYRRTPAESASHVAWNLAWFGNDVTDPTANYGLQSVYIEEQTDRLSIVN